MSWPTDELAPDGGPLGPAAAGSSEGWPAGSDTPQPLSPVPYAVNGAPDLQAQAQGRVIAQYRNAIKLRSTIAGNVGILQEIANALMQIPGLDDPDDAGGANLDDTAELIGADRNLPNGRRVGDDTLRMLIACRIARNVAHGTHPEVLAQLERIFPGVEIRLEDNGGMAFTFAVGRQPTDDERSIIVDLDILPRPVGVRIRAGWYVQGNFFGFSDTLGASGFGEADGSGGRWAEGWI